MNMASEHKVCMMSLLDEPACLKGRISKVSRSRMKLRDQRKYDVSYGDKFNSIAYVWSFSRLSV